MGRSPLFRFLVQGLQEARRRNLAETGAPPPRPRIGPALTRRALLAGSGAVAASAVLLRHMPAAAASGRRVAVVGAGISGLSAAHHLLAAGHDVVVYEARQRVGGRMYSRVGPLGDALITDFGAELVNTDHTDIRSLCEAYEVGLFDRDKATEGLNVPAYALHFGGKALTVADLAEIFRGIAGQIAIDAERVDADDAALAEIDAMTVAAYLDLHAGLMPSPVARALLEAGTRTEYGLEPGEASALSLIFNLPSVDGQSVDIIASDEVFSIEGGSQALPRAIAKVLGDRVRTRTPIVSIRQVGTGIEIVADNRQTDTYDAVVVATPFPPLRRVSIEADLPALFRRFVEEFGPGHNEKIVAAFKGRPWREAGVFAGEAWTDTSVPLVWDSSLRQPDLPESALTFFFGGDPAREIQTIDGDFVAQLALERLDAVVPGSRAAATGKHVKTDWLGEWYTGGAYAAYRPGQVSTFGDFFWVEGETPEAHSGPIFGRIAFSGEHLSDLYGGYMNGGAETGRLAAEALNVVLAAG